MNNKGPVVPPITLSKPAMAHITIDHIQDARLLVIPSMRRIPTPKEMASFVTRLAPIEMAAPSLTSPPHPAALHAEGGARAPAAQQQQ